MPSLLVTARIAVTDVVSSRIAMIDIVTSRIAMIEIVIMIVIDCCAGVTVSNAVSSARASRVLPVLHPRPMGLQLLPFRQGLLHTPSCLRRSALSSPSRSSSPSSSSFHSCRLWGQDGGHHGHGGGVGVGTLLTGGRSTALAQGNRGMGNARGASIAQQPGSAWQQAPATGKVINNFNRPDLSRGSYEEEVDDGDDGIAKVATFAGELFELWAGVSTGMTPTFRVSGIGRCTEHGLVTLPDDSGVVSRIAPGDPLDQLSVVQVSGRACTG